MVFCSENPIFVKQKEFMKGIVMKKFYILLAAISLFTFVACDKDKDNTPSEGNTEHKKIKTLIEYAEDGVSLISRTEYEYDELGRLINFKTYHADELSYECVNFRYDDLTMTYTYNYYIEGSKVHTRNYTCIYYE